MWMWSLSKYLIVLSSPFFLGRCDMTWFLCDDREWGEGCRHYNIVLGCYWPSDDASEGGSSASGGPGSLSHDDTEGWMSGADSVHGQGKLVFSDQGRPQVIETVESKIASKGHTTVFVQSFLFCPFFTKRDHCIHIVLQLAFSLTNLLWITLKVNMKKLFFSKVLDEEQYPTSQCSFWKIFLWAMRFL